MPKITKSVVEATRPTDSDVVLWDSELRGFGVRVKPSGVRSYLVQYRNAHGRSRRVTVGMHGRLTQRKPAGRRAYCWRTWSGGATLPRCETLYGGPRQWRSCARAI